MAKFCSNCGKQLDDAVKFCSNCGAQQKPLQQTQQEPQPPPAQEILQPPPVQEAQPYAQSQQPYVQPQQQYQQPVQPVQPVQQPVQPVQQPVMTQKQQTLYYAPGTLNRPELPWYVTVEGDAIVARWKWMDATFFSPHEVTNETRDYTFTVILSDKGTWREVDKTEEKTSGMKMSGGKLSFGSSSSSFIGKTNQKSFTFGAGKDNQTGEVGLIGFKFNTTDVKQPIRDYLTYYGWKKAGLFG